MSLTLFVLQRFVILDKTEKKESSVSVFTNSGYRSSSMVECIVMTTRLFLPAIAVRPESILVSIVPVPTAVQDCRVVWVRWAVDERYCR